LAVAILLAATAAAIVETQHLRDQGPVVSSTKLKTRRDGGYRICFNLTRNDTVRVAVVNAADQEVRVLADAAPLSGSDSAPNRPKAGAHCFDWDGADASGTPVSAGIYRMRLSFQRADRVLIPGEHLTIAVRGATS
jgi:flagellar hook assembly protein FlgD